MRQAIEEGFILDVLKNYTPYKLAFKLANGGPHPGPLPEGEGEQGCRGLHNEWDEKTVERSEASPTPPAN